MHNAVTLVNTVAENAERYSKVDYSQGHLHTTLKAIAMKQYTLNKGIKLFQDSGIEAISKELEQLHVRKVLQPNDGTDFTVTQRRDALQYLMFLNQKRDGKIKARGYADGQKQ